jgi:Tfp pilus assembly protein PilN
MMIRINLLPSENRKKEMTPLGTLLPVLVSLTLVTGAGAFWAWLHFGELAQRRSEYSALEETANQQKPQLAYLNSLRAEEADYKERAKTIQEIALSRVPWTRKLDELCQVVTDDHGGERYLVWLSSMEVKPPDNRAAATSGSKSKKQLEGEQVSIEGLCFSGINDDADPLQRYNNFHEAIKQSDFYREDFVAIGNPVGKAVTMDDELKPSRAWTVDLPLTMRARQPAAKSGVEAEASKKAK